MSTWEKGNPSLYTVGGNANWYSHCGKQYEISQEIKKRTSIRSSNPTSVYPKETKLLSQRGIFTPMLIAVLCTIAKIWKQPKYLSMEEWISVVYICTMKCYSVLKEKESCHL